MNAQIANPSLPSAVGPRTAPLTGRFFLKQQLILCLLIVTVRLFTLYAIPDEIGRSVKVDRLDLPNSMAGWKGRDVKINPFVYEVLHPDSVVQKRFTLTNSGATRPPQIEILVMYTRDTEGFHPPDVCMKADGWVISRHEQREVKSNGQSLLLDVVTGEQREQKKLLAYTFSDATGAVTGRTATFANMVFSRFMRRKIGALEIQFAYGADVLTPDGDFNPQCKALMLQTANTIYAQLKAKINASSSANSSPSNSL